MARRETGRNNEAGRLVTELFFFLFLTALDEVKVNG